MHVQEERHPAADDRRAEDALIVFRSGPARSTDSDSVSTIRVTRIAIGWATNLGRISGTPRRHLPGQALGAETLHHLVEPQEAHRHPVHRHVFVLADALDPIAADHLDPADLQQRQGELLVRAVLEEQDPMRLGRLPGRPGRWPPPSMAGSKLRPGVVDDPRHVGDQRDAAVAHDRRAGEDVDLLDRGMHRLDDDLLRAPDLIHDQPETAAG